MKLQISPKGVTFAGGVSDATGNKEEGKRSSVLYTTTRGVTVECLPIADALDAQEEAIRKSVKWPIAPTRVATDVAGVSVEIALTSEYLKDYGTTEQQEAYEAYQTELIAATRKFELLLKEARPKLLATKGVTWAEEKEAQWVADHEWIGTPLPPDPRERKLYFFRMEVLGSLDDLYSILMGIYRATGYDEEVLDQVEESFRRSLEQKRSREEGEGEKEGSLPSDDTPDLEVSPEEPIELADAS